VRPIIDSVTAYNMYIINYLTLLSFTGEQSKNGHFRPFLVPKMPFLVQKQPFLVQFQPPAALGSRANRQRRSVTYFSRGAVGGAIAFFAVPLLTGVTGAFSAVLASG
jgi:hypothetical protein